MPLIISRQIKQPRYSLALEYHLIHNGRNDLQAIFHFFGENPKLFHFHEANIP